jgi:protein-disulfide isomerase
MTKTLDTVANVITIVAGVALIGLAIPRLVHKSSAEPEPPVKHVTNVATALPVPFVKGSPHARIALIEFSDFQCPYCGAFARATFQDLQREFIASEKVIFGFRNYPLANIHPFATNAALAAVCAGEQEQFWNMHDRLFGNQLALDNASLLASAAGIGIPAQDFASCLSQEHGSAATRLANDVQEARRIGIKSTPTFLIGTVAQDGSVRVDSVIEGNRPVSTFEHVLQNDLAQSQRTMLLR